MKKLTTMTLKDVEAHKAEVIRNYENNKIYMGHNFMDNMINYVLNMPNEDYMKMHNEVVEKNNRAAEQAKAKRQALSAERKATGISKREYRAEYDRLMEEYKNGNYSAKAEAKKIARFAF